MQIFFIESVHFSEKNLKKFLNLKEYIVGIINKKTPKFNSDFLKVLSIALKHNIPYLLSKKINTHTVLSWFKKYLLRY